MPACTAGSPVRLVPSPRLIPSQITSLALVVSAPATGLRESRTHNWSRL